MANTALARARAAIEMRRADDAVREAGLAVAEAPQDATCYGILAQALLLKADWPGALDAAQAGLQWAPESEWLHRQRSICLRHLKRPKEALAAADEALRLDPDVAFGHRTRGEALVALKRLDEAQAAYEQALKVDPDYHEVHSALGFLHLERKQWAKGEAHYRQALAADPRDPVALNNLGVALEKQGKQDEAGLAYKSAVLLDPSLDTAKRNVHANVTNHLDGAVKGVAVGGAGLAFAAKACLVGGRTASIASHGHGDFAALIGGVAVLVGLVVLVAWIAGKGDRERKRAAALASLDPQLAAIYKQVDADKRAGRL